MARRRVCRSSHVCTLTLLLWLVPVAALAQQPAVSITGAPSFADRHSTFTVTVTSTAPPLATATFSLAANFADVTFSEPGWSLTCGLSSCSSTRTVTVFTGATGGRNLQITATGRNGAFTATALLNVWVRGASNFSPATVTTQTLQTQSMSIVLQTPAPLGVTFQLLPGGPAAAGSTVPATVTIGAGGTSVSFSITTGPNGGILSIAATTGTPYYTAPPTFVAQVVNPTEVPTPAGTNVTVIPPVPPAGAVPIRVTFTEVTASGHTKLTNIAAPAAPPSGYEVPGTPLYFGVSTTATTSGAVMICATYPEGAAVDETGLRLFTLAGGGWIDTTASVDAGANVICGSVAGIAGSTFAIFRLNSAPVVGAIAGPASIVGAGTAQQFSATFTDADATDTHTGVWMWGDGSTSPAVITNSGGTLTASGEHAFGAGTHQVSLVITDGGQPDSSDTYQVIADGAAPVIHSLTATPGSLSHPYNKMVDVLLAVSATDDTGTPGCQITAVSATSGNAKHTAFQLTGPLAVQLKSFPNAAYSIDVTCTDAIGRQTSRSVSVAVEK